MDKMEIVFNPQKEKDCDALLKHPALRTPPPEPEKPKPPKVRKKKEIKIPERFPLLSKDFYDFWCNHFKEIRAAKPKVDNHPAPLDPEVYLKPRRLNIYAKELKNNMMVNKEILRRINYIQRTGGAVDCWQPEHSEEYIKRLCRQRQIKADQIRQKNLNFYHRLLEAKSDQPGTKELEELWKKTKHKLICMASLPFILFKTGKIDNDTHDPAFDKPPGVYRTKAVLEIWVRDGGKIGRVTVELFNDIVPETVKLFLKLIKGDKAGHGYQGTRFFRIVPNLYCCGGDVTKDNGFGCYLPEGYNYPMTPESFELCHTVPGVLSMVVSKQNEVCGIFNIIFKPIPQFDGKHVVFGRITAGPVDTLERISVLGHPLGNTSTDCIIRYCGFYTKSGSFRPGRENTIKGDCRSDYENQYRSKHFCVTMIYGSI